MPPQASTIMCTWIGRREAANNNTKFYISGEVVANTRLYNLKQFDMYMHRISEAKHEFLITVSNHGEVKWSDNLYSAKKSEEL